MITIWKCGPNIWKGHNFGEGNYAILELRIFVNIFMAAVIIKCVLEKYLVIMWLLLIAI